MIPVKPDAVTITLRKLLSDIGCDDPWGSGEGTRVRAKLARAVEDYSSSNIVRLSLAGIRRTDASFLREAVVELVRSFRGRRGMCVVDVASEDVFDNLHAAALVSGQAVIVWTEKGPQLVGPKPTDDTWELLKVVLTNGAVTTAEAAKLLGKQVNNVSTRLKRLTDEGLTVRQDVIAATGGIEYRYLAAR